MTTENENKAVAVKQAADIVTTYCQKFKKVPIAQALIAEGKGKLMDKIMANFYFICRKNGNAVQTWDRNSIVEALTKCCQWELVPDSTYACLIPYGKNLTFQPMYQGLLELAYRTGMFQSVSANVVYEGDTFDYDIGGKPFTTHKPSLTTDRIKPIAVYADVLLNNGGRIVKVMTMKEVNAIRNVAKNKTVWQAWPDAMAIKTVIKQVFKLCPKTEKLNELIAYDNSLEQTFEAKVIDTSKAENLNKLISGQSPEPVDMQPEYLDAEPERTVQVINTVKVANNLKTADEVAEQGASHD